MASNFHFSLLLISLFIFFHLSSADDALIQTVCEDSNDNSFCFQLFRSDPLSATADPNGLCHISLTHVIEHVRSTRDKIPGLLKHATNPTMKERLNYCQLNYNDAALRFREAFTSAENKAYRDVLTKLGQGFYNATLCQSVFARGTSLQAESPFTADTNQLDKLVVLPPLVINRLSLIT